MNISSHMLKSSRYTIGTRIENKFLDLLEFSYTAYFSKKDSKSEKISDCIFILDKLKFLITIAWEVKLVANKQYEELALKLEEVGRMLGGWKNKIDSPQKKNRLA